MIAPPMRCRVWAPSECRLSEHYCPAQMDRLGRTTWHYLHTAASSLPHDSGPVDVGRVRRLIQQSLKTYPCFPNDNECEKANILAAVSTFTVPFNYKLTFIKSLNNVLIHVQIAGFV